MLKIGVVLSGCGFQDGAEIQESVFTLYHLDHAGVEIECMAPNINQSKVVNHLTGEAANETRNVLVESARIARGNIKDIKAVNLNELDAVIFPGGFGAALNLSDFALKGAEATVNDDVDNLIREMHKMGKPLGFICISPVVAAKVLGNEVEHKLKLTIGNDKDTAQAIHDMNAVHEAATVDDAVVDLENRVISTPAYMLGPGPRDIYKGIEKLVRQVLIMAESLKKVSV